MATDWAAEVAEAILGEIPRSIHSDWADDVPQKIAAMLRMQASLQASDPASQATISSVVALLPSYLSAQVAARTRAKLIGAALAVRALGQHQRLAAQPDILATD